MVLLGETTEDENSPISLITMSLSFDPLFTLQMLVAFRRDMLAEGAQVQWRGASAKLKKTAGLLGLAEELNL